MRYANLIIAAVLIISMAVGCAPQSVQKPPDKVTLQLKWLHQAQFAGFYVAKDKGYYARENIDITLVEAAADTDIIDRVVSGQADFGVHSADTILLSRSKGKPVTAVAVIYKRSPVVFVTLTSSGIKSPADFLDKTAALEGAAFVDARLQFFAMIEKLGLDKTRIKTVPYEYDYASFKKGDVDISYSYTTGGLIRLLQQGIQVNRILPEEYGIHMYSDTLFTSDTLIMNNPDLVTRFVRASLKGWQDAIGNPNEAVQVTMKYAREKDSSIQSKMMEAQLPLVYDGEEVVGWMRPEIWSGMYQMLLNQKLLDKPFDPDTAYTMDFITKIYGGKNK
jgi:NitT/TauT family transport system substrate-binding protein